jgi:hypothetical protein
VGGQGPWTGGAGPGGSGGGGLPCTAVRAQAAVDDVGRLDGEAVALMGDQAGGGADGAGDVLETPAAAAHQVVVVQ